MIKWLIALALTMAFCCFPFQVMADILSPPSADEINALLGSFGGIAGMKALGIAYVGVQAFMLILRSQAGELLGKYRLVIVYLISIVMGVLALIASGVGVGAALIHANTLAAFGVFFNQIYKQFITKIE